MDPVTDHNRRMWILAILIGLIAFLVFNQTTLEYLLSGYQSLTGYPLPEEAPLLLSMVMLEVLIIIIRVLLQ
jgi:hypothetical protein